MRADALLLCVAVLSTSCANRSGTLPYNTLTGSPHEERQPAWEASPRSIAGDALQRRLLRRKAPQDETTGVASGGLAGASAASAAQVRYALLEAVSEVEDSTETLSSALSKLARRPPTSLGNRGLSGVNGVFTGYLDYGSSQLPWLRGALGGTEELAAVAQQVGDADMELVILRMTGPRLQSAMFGSMLLAAWLDFLTLADAVLRECPAYGVETLLMDVQRVQQRIAPVMAALASGGPEQSEDAALAMPGLMGQLTREFGSIRDGARTAMENAGKTLAVAQWVELLTMVSALKMSLPRLPPAAPATAGVTLVMSSGGVMAGSQAVVSAEWVEMIRRLVQAGVLSIPAVGAAVRIYGGQVMMAQASGDPPEGLREALGGSPEVRGMRETGRAGAGMSEHPKHHVMPQEHRAWFEERGFKGDMDINRFCVRLERAHHEAIHGGGDWRLGRTWPGEWNRMIMDELRRAEARTGEMLTRREVLKIVARLMKTYDIPIRFSRWRSQ